MKAKLTLSDLTHDNISSRAYQLWQEHGRPDGNDIDCWLRAEGELVAAVRRPEKSMDGARVREFLDAFTSSASSRSPTSLNFT